MFTSNKLAIAVRCAAFGMAAASTLAVPAVTAAEEGAVQAAERIQVTGSKISRSDMETASPVSIIDADAIAASGAPSLGNLLQTLSVSGGAMTNPAVNNGSNGNARVNLRGLGAERTLVLVNGRRMIASGTGAASTVDLNTIPVSMIERLEVLKDGASAIYGTDAVAGVVNVILKRQFDGFSLNVQTGRSGQNDAEESTLDFTLGTSSNKGNLVFGVQYTNRGEASQASRDFSKCPVSETGTPPTLYCGGSSYAEGGHVWGETADLSGRGGSFHDFVYSGEGNDKYNYSKDSYLFTPMERLSLTVAGNYDLTDDMTFFTEAMYTKRWSKQQMAPQPIWNSESWAYNPISGGGIDHNGNGIIDEGTAEAGWMTDALMPWVEVGEMLDYGRRTVETGTRNFSQVVDTVRIVLGLEGQLDNGWIWDVSYNKGKNDSTDKLANLHNIGSINTAVQAGEFDPFLESSWAADSVSRFVYTEVNSGGSEMDIFAASLNGDLLDLPAGTLGFAAGIEHRKEEAYYTPDSLTAQGLANDPRVEPTSGSFDVNEAFVEFAIPVIDGLEVSAAARYFDYSTFGSDSTWKLGVTWNVTEELMLRGVASTAFRAPTVDELFGGESPSFEQVQHPASPDQDQAEVTVGGNPLLTPEEADIFTVGAVYEPSFVDGLSLTVDYYDIELSNAISTVDHSYVANQCLGNDGSLINTGSAMCQAAEIALDGTGRISFKNGLQNVGGQATSGVDINVVYAFSAADLNWRASWDTSILTDFVESDQDGNEVEYKGFITAGVGAYADVKSNLSLRVEADDWDATYEVRYIDGMDSFIGKCQADASKCYAPTVPSVTYHDIAGTYHLSDNVTLSGGVNNLFDKQPPYFTGNNDSNTDPYTYDVLGRYFFLKAGLKF